VFSDSKTFTEVGNGPNWLVTSFHFKTEVCAKDTADKQNSSPMNSPLFNAILDFIYFSIIFYQPLMFKSSTKK
jgi:hypothetical protein